MYVFAIFAVMAMLIAGYETFGAEQMTSAYRASTQSLALNMAEYRQSVIDYVLAHPSFQGRVSANQLPSSAHYAPNALWQNYVQGNTVVVYATSPVSLELIADIARLSQGSVLAGSAQNGNEVPPGDSSVAIPLPAAIAASIPNGEPVWLAQVYPG